MLCRVGDCWRNSLEKVLGGCAFVFEIAGSLAIDLYMATRTPVAHNTRSRHRKRPGSLVEGLPPRKASVSKAKVLSEKEDGDIAFPERAVSPLRKVCTTENKEDSTFIPSGMGRRKRLSTKQKNETMKCQVILAGDDSPLSIDDNHTAALQVEEQKTTNRKSKMEKKSLIPTPCDDTLVEIVEPTVIVLKMEELTRVDSIETAVAQVAELSASDEWLNQYEAVTTVRRLVKYHVKDSSEPIYDDLKNVITLLRNGVGSLRSALSRNSLFAIKELLDHLPHQRLLLDAAGSQLTALVDSVVLKAVNDKRFIASAGEEVLQRLSETCPSNQVLLALLSHSSSKNPKLCSVISHAAATCLSKMLSLSLNALSFPEAMTEQMISSFAALELSRSVDAKKPAQACLRMLYKTIPATEFEKALYAAVSPTSASQILSMVRKTRPQKNIKAPSLRDIMAEKRRALSKENKNADQSGLILG